MSFSRFATKAVVFILLLTFPFSNSPTYSTPISLSMTHMEERPSLARPGSFVTARSFTEFKNLLGISVSEENTAHSRSLLEDAKQRFGLSPKPITLRVELRNSRTIGLDKLDLSSALGVDSRAVPLASDSSEVAKGTAGPLASLPESTTRAELRSNGSFKSDEIRESDLQALFTLQLGPALKLFEQIIKTVKSVHSYEVPEIIALPIIAGNIDYLKWIDDSVL